MLCVPCCVCPMQDSYTCGRCHSAATCAAVHAVLEGGSAESSGMEPEQWKQLAGGRLGGRAGNRQGAGDCSGVCCQQIFQPAITRDSLRSCAAFECTQPSSQRRTALVLACAFPPTPCGLVALCVCSFTLPVYLTCHLPGGVSVSAAAWGSKWVQLLDWEESGGRARKPEVWALTGD